VLGRELMPWQRQASQLLNEHNAGVRTRPFTVVTIQRQAGKTTWLLAEALERCLFGGPFRRVWYTAQNGQYAREKWGELVAELTGPGAPLRRKIESKFTNGTERLIFPNGSTLRPFPPTKDALHSMQSDLVILDEAWKHDAVRGAELMQAIGPTQATRPGAQVVVVSTAGTADSTFLRPLVDRGRGGDPAVTYLEWGIADDVDPMDLDAVAAAHPAIGRTIDRQFLVDQAGIMAATPGEFARAYGNRWTTTLEQLIPAVAWAAIRHRDGIPADGVPPVLGADVAVDRSAAAVVACWPDLEGTPTLEVVAYGPGTDWVAGRLLELHAAHGSPVVLDGGTGPASTVVDQLRTAEQLPTWVRAVTPREYTTACAQLLDGIGDRTVRHRGDPALDAAVGAAARRTVGEGWAWSRRLPTTDVSPLIAASLALFGDRHRPPNPVRPVAYAG
jgi:phage terminase large subunit-like protein